MKTIIKFIAKLFAYILLLFSFLFPRNRKLWTYGSNMGFVGNAKYLFIYTSSLIDIKSIWIGNKNEVYAIRKLGLTAYEKYSIKGLFYSLISGIYIYNSYVSDINLYTFGTAKRINLWHGVGIKNCERKITTGPLAEIFKTDNPFIKLKYLAHFVKPHLFLSTSEQMKNLCKDCFGLGYNQFVDNMYPRCDIFFLNEKARYNFIMKYENEATIALVDEMKHYVYTYLYMPTWRDSGYNFLADFDFETLNNLLQERNELMLLKLHPVTRISLDKQYSNIKIVNKYVDLNSLMSYTDCLITDYSSVYYDYITIPNKRLILYIPDYVNYTTNDRDLAFDYMESTEGEFAYEFKELLALVSTRSEKFYSYERIAEIRDRFWGNAIGTSSKDLFEKIEATL